MNSQNSQNRKKIWKLPILLKLKINKTYSGIVNNKHEKSWKNEGPKPS